MTRSPDGMAGIECRAFAIEAKEMAGKRPTTIAEYIRAAPREGQPHLRRLYAILKSVAPGAEEAIKWGTPFFVEPRHKTTKRFLQIPYNKPLPEDLIRKIAERRVQDVREREDDAFW